MSPRIVRNKYHRSAIPWPADALAGVPLGVAYVVAVQRRPWVRKMTVTPCSSWAEAYRVVDAIGQQDEWITPRVIGLPPLQRRGWAIMVVAPEEWAAMA